MAVELNLHVLQYPDQFLAALELRSSFVRKELLTRILASHNIKIRKGFIVRRIGENMFVRCLTEVRLSVQVGCLVLSSNRRRGFFFQDEEGYLDNGKQEWSGTRFPGCKQLPDNVKGRITRQIFA